MEGLSQTGIATAQGRSRNDFSWWLFLSPPAKPSGIASMYGCIPRPCPSGMQAELGASPLGVANSSVS